MTAYWRIRLTNAEGEFTRRAWDRNETGIWYGAWTSNDFEAASSQSSASGEIAAQLSALPAQRELGWNVSASYVDTAWRFKNISDEDWVVVYLSHTKEIALAKVHGPLRSDPNHPLNSRGGEFFKYRTIRDKKTFKLSRLPDAYWLLRSQGQSNVFRFNSMREHVRLLAEHMNEAGVNRAFSEKPFNELLDLLGAFAWESFCYAYLLWEEDFVPTGLSVGRTLPTVDIIGRRRNGSRIIAQCKKHPTAQSIDCEFLTLSESLAPEDTAFYFAYGGCTNEAPNNIRVIDRTDVLQWAETKNGQLYRRLLLGDALASSAPVTSSNPFPSRSVADELKLTVFGERV
jgi:hypothetical protein